MTVHPKTIRYHLYEDVAETQDINLPYITWLVAVSHRLDPYLEDLMEAGVITKEQYCLVDKRKSDKGKSCALRLLTKFIIENETVGELRNLVQVWQLDVADDYQSSTGSESSSDDEKRTNPMFALTFVPLFHGNETQPGLEDLLQNDIITRHHYVRIVDISASSGDYQAICFLLRVLKRKKRVGRFLAWYCGHFDFPAEALPAVTTAIEHG